MEQAQKMSRCADDSGKGHRAACRGIAEGDAGSREDIRIPLILYAPCAMLYAHSFKADGTNVSFLHNRMNEFDLHDLKDGIS